MGAAAGAFAAAATTPLDVIKTHMMCSAASRPTMASAARAVAAQGGPACFFRCACTWRVIGWACRELGHEDAPPDGLLTG